MNITTNGRTYSLQATTLKAAGPDTPTTLTLGQKIDGPAILIDNDPPLDMLNVLCLVCGWKGKGYQLKAQACPVCDGRCADV